MTRRINKEKFKTLVIEAEKGDKESEAIVAEVLRPRKTDTVEQILEKIHYFIRIIFLGSLTFKDAPFHKDIDRFYAEQIHNLLNTGQPKYKGAMIIGYRESAKTSRVKFNEAYATVYLPELLDLTRIVSADGKNANQFNMDMFNTLAFSRIAKYYPDTISLAHKKKKESQTMSKFTTKTGVTYSASAARVTSRGDVKMDIGEDMEVEAKRPKKIIFDDIENENTIRSLATTEQIATVMSSTINGLDQVAGFWVFLGNYLSLRGNVAHYLKRYKDRPDYKVIEIPIMDGAGNPLWADKYVRTDEEQAKLREQGVIKVSIESIERDSENFDVEFMNNPARSSVYFKEKAVAGISKNEENLVGETGRDESGLLVIDEPVDTATYIMGVDTSKGVGRDQSSFTVIRVDGLRFTEVANFKSTNITPEELAPYSANVATRYNNALIIPENNYPGNEYIAFLRNVYKNIFIADRKVDEFGAEQVEYGVNTNLKTKEEMFLLAKEILINDLFLVQSQILYDQLLEYPDTDLHVIRKRDGSGGHFDLLMSAVIALYKASSISAKAHNTEEMDRILAQKNRGAFRDRTNYR